MKQPLHQAPPRQILLFADAMRSHACSAISARAMITRMISLVPSRIWCTRRSRTIFSMP